MKSQASAYKSLLRNHHSLGRCGKIPPVSLYWNIAAVLIAVMLSAAPSMAASFVFTAEELANASVEVKAASAQSVSEVLAGTRSTNGIIQIDDMLFREDSLLLRSGFTGQKWTNNAIYYEFDANVTLENQARWIEAAAEWAAVANLYFLPRTTEPNFIHVQDANVNNSYVGMIGGSQEMNIANWSFKYIIVHEIGHALGLRHEQSRSDRDAYVTILLENVDPSNHWIFNKHASINYTPYDFDSKMHYGKNFFTINEFNSVEPKAPYEAWLNVIGQRDHLSIYDGVGMAARYGTLINPRITFLSFPLDSDPGWTTEGQWAYGVPLGLGSNGGDPTSGNTGPNVYGYNLNGDYPNLMSEENLTTGALDFSNWDHVELRFWRWLGVESSRWDHARIEASTDGASWTTVWENSPSSIRTGVWVQLDADLSDFNREPTVFVRWVMGASDGSVTYPGWNIDDVEFRGTVPVPPPLPMTWGWSFGALMLAGIAVVCKRNTGKCSN